MPEEPDRKPRQALSASLEDYLEAIYHIVTKKQAARAKDIAQRLGVNSSSVTGALHALSEKGLVNYAPYDIITLTPEGQALAKDVVRRHDTLLDFFVKVLNIDRDAAEKAACEMEHAMPKVVLERFVQFIDYVETCPRGGPLWLKGFGYRCVHGEASRDCERCIAAVLAEVKACAVEEGGVPVVSVPGCQNREPRQSTE